MPTLVHLTSGATLVVEEEPEQVAELLEAQATGGRFRFMTRIGEGADAVYLNRGAVSFLSAEPHPEAVPRPES